jgi:hypothetical protein
MGIENPTDDQINHISRVARRDLIVGAVLSAAYLVLGFVLYIWYPRSRPFLGFVGISVLGLLFFYGRYSGWRKP